VALVDAVNNIRSEEDPSFDKPFPVTDFIAATSVGIVDGQVMLDLTFEEDSRASVDMNVVMTGCGKLAEVQGTAEGSPFTKAELDEMLKVAESGIMSLIKLQKEVLGDLARKVGR
jgi:ribonuclease PH